MAETPVKSGSGGDAKQGRDLGLRVLGGAGLAFFLFMILRNIVRSVELLFPPGR